MSKITKLKTRPKGRFLIMGILVTVFSVMGAFGLSMALASWGADDLPGSAPGTASMPPGPVWLQNTSPYDYQEGGIYLDGVLNIQNTASVTNPEISFIDGSNHWAVYGDAGTDDLKFWNNYGTSADKFIFTDDGDFNLQGGIGAWDGSSHVFGTSGQVLSSTGTGLAWIDASTAGGGAAAEGLLEAYQAVSNDVLMTDSSGGDIRFSNDEATPDEILFLAESSGNVGIGTTDPGLYKLKVVGTLDINTIGSPFVFAALHINEQEAIQYNGGVFSWGFDGSANYFAKDVGIGTATPTAKLDVDGKVKAVDFQMTSGSPAAGQVLTSLDADGNAAWAASKSYIVGSITSPGGGNQGGYLGINAKCSSGFAGSHLCTTNEVLDTINSGGIDGSSYTGYYWVSAGINFPVVDADVSDCIGWTSASSGSPGTNDYGLIWSFSSGYNTYISICSDIDNDFLCCK